MHTPCLASVSLFRFSVGLSGPGPRLWAALLSLSRGRPEMQAAVWAGRKRERSRADAVLQGPRPRAGVRRPGVGLGSALVLLAVRAGVWVSEASVTCSHRALSPAGPVGCVRIQALLTLACLSEPALAMAGKVCSLPSSTSQLGISPSVPHPWLTLHGVPFFRGLGEHFTGRGCPCGP